VLPRAKQSDFAVRLSPQPSKAATMASSASSVVAWPMLLRSNPLVGSKARSDEWRAWALTDGVFDLDDAAADGAKLLTGLSPIASSTPIAPYQASSASAELRSEAAICLAARDFLCVMAHYDRGSQYSRLVPPAKARIQPERPDLEFKP